MLEFSDTSLKQPSQTCFTGQIWKTNFKNRKSQKRWRRYKEEPSKSLKLKSRLAKIKCSSVMRSTREWRGKEKASVNLKIEE